MREVGGGGLKSGGRLLKGFFPLLNKQKKKQRGKLLCFLSNPALLSKNRDVFQNSKAISVDVVLFLSKFFWRTRGSRE